MFAHVGNRNLFMAAAKEAGVKRWTKVHGDEGWSITITAPGPHLWDGDGHRKTVTRKTYKEMWGAAYEAVKSAKFVACTDPACEYCAPSEEVRETPPGAFAIFEGAASRAELVVTDRVLGKTEGVEMVVFDDDLRSSIGNELIPRGFALGVVFGDAEPVILPDVAAAANYARDLVKLPGTAIMALDEARDSYAKVLHVRSERCYHGPSFGRLHVTHAVFETANCFADVTSYDDVVRVTVADIDASGRASVRKGWPAFEAIDDASDFACKCVEG